MVWEDVAVLMLRGALSHGRAKTEMWRCATNAGRTLLQRRDVCCPLPHTHTNKNKNKNNRTDELFVPCSKQPLTRGGHIPDLSHSQPRTHTGDPRVSTCVAVPVI